MVAQALGVVLIDCTQLGMCGRLGTVMVRYAAGPSGLGLSAPWSPVAVPTVGTRTERR
jgi:hypothetical protein